MGFAPPSLSSSPASLPNRSPILTIFFSTLSWLVTLILTAGFWRPFLPVDLASWVYVPILRSAVVFQEAVRILFWRQYGFEEMGWVVAAVAGLVLSAFNLGIWIRPPIVDPFSSSQPYQLKEDEEDRSRCFPALFSFGSSVADTGTQAIAFSLQPTQYSPYGSTFFGKPANRYSDGRLHIDFWARALKIPFVDPYVKMVGSNFRRGVNFASSGARATNHTEASPFSLSVQLNQFRQFKRDVFSLILEGSTSSSQNTDDYSKLPREQYFGEALYIIAIGGNDIQAWALFEKLSLQEVESLIPQISDEILRVVEALYAGGARHILVEDIFPQGCSPTFLVHFATQHPEQLDAAGCYKPINDLVQMHNDLLRRGIADLGKRLADASLSCVDTYRRRYAIIANHDQYGFTEPIKSCCGTGGGEYNTRADIRCGSSLTENGILITAGMCDNVSRHAVWDHVHYTEGFNRVTMQGLLSGEYFEPRFDLVRNGCVLGEI